MNTKLIPIILVIIILAVGIIAFNFYQGLQLANTKNQELTDENTGLVEKNNSLTNKVNQVSREKADVEQRLALIEEELSRVQEERDSWKQKWADISRERDDLVEKLKEAPKTRVMVSESTAQPGEMSEQNWADFVAKKAALEAKLDTLNQTLIDAKAKLAELDKTNKELSIKIDQLTKDRERLTEEVKFKERTLRVMSMDLVSERGERSAAVEELRKLRSENVNLKREIVVANKEKMRLQTTLKETMETKQELENRISEVETYMKDKSLAFEELQDQLSQTIAGAKRVTSVESASVELPPIVVKPSVPDLRGLKGEVIAVNEEESFIVVDIGESAGLRPGFLLKVMRGGREIGTAEIIETRAEIAAADIRETVSGFNIQEGDMVVGR